MLVIVALLEGSQRAPHPSLLHAVSIACQWGVFSPEENKKEREDCGLPFGVSPTYTGP